MINAVSTKKARKLFCTSFGNFLSLNPFGMKLLVIGWKTALAFLRKNSLFRLTKASSGERYYKPAFPSCTFNLELYDLYPQ